MGTTQPHIKITSLILWKTMRYAASLLIILGLKGLGVGLARLSW